MLGLKRNVLSFVDDHSFFAEPNRLNSYIAGFIAADGNVYKNEVGIQVARTDIVHLTKMMYCIAPRVVIKDYKKAGVCAAKFKSQQIVDDLAKNYNIGPNKSLTLGPPNLRRKSDIKAFITGYLDGDGSVFYPKGSGNWRYIAVNFTGAHDILEWTQAQLPHGARVEPGNGNCFVIRWSGKKAYDNHNHLHDPSLPILTRKWDGKVYKIYQGVRA